MTESVQTSNGTSWRPVALTLVVAAIALSVAYRFIPYEHRLPNLTPVGALCLFAGARLRLWQALLVPLIIFGVTDLIFLQTRSWEIPLVSHSFFVLYVLLGYVLLRRTESPIGIGLTAFGGSVLFFLTSNFVSWLNQSLDYGWGIEGLMKCYGAALPFYQGTLIGDVVFSAAFFGAYAWLTRTYFPAERVVPATIPAR